MTSTNKQGLTAREAAKEYCHPWSWAVYCSVWPGTPEHHLSESDLKEQKYEQKKTNKKLSDELKAMLRLPPDQKKETAPPAPDPVVTRKNKVIHRGHLPKQDGKAGKSPIIAGLLAGKISFLKVDAQGAWILEEREGAFLYLIIGEGPYSVMERFIITREDGATCELTVILEVTEKDTENSVPEKTIKCATHVKNKAKSWTPIPKNGDEVELANAVTLAHALDFHRKVEESDEFAGSPQVPLRLEGQLGIHQPLAKFSFEDIRNVEIDIDKGSASGDGRKYEGLRFFEASLVLEDEAAAGDEEGSDPHPEPGAESTVREAEAEETDGARASIAGSGDVARQNQKPNSRQPDSKQGKSKRDPINEQYGQPLPNTHTDNKETIIDRNRRWHRRWVELSNPENGIAPSNESIFRTIAKEEDGHIGRKDTVKAAVNEIRRR